MAEDLKLGIRRLGPSLVRVQVRPGYTINEPGVICVNPEAPVERQIFRKDFERKPVYLPHQYEEAMNTHVRIQNGVVVSMNGYSSLKPEWLAKYGIKEGAYEAACAATFEAMINHIQRKFQAAQVRVIHGASHMGVDGVVDRVTKSAIGLMPLGFSCPDFMMWVPDDETPVYVAENKKEYADAYIRSLDLLVTTGGRIHALEHDTLAACLYDKRVHFVDIPNMLSTSSVPPRIILPDGKVMIENAAAAFGRNISFSERFEGRSQVPANGDRWDALFEAIGGVATEVARRTLPPQHMFTTRR